MKNVILLIAAVAYSSITMALPVDASAPGFYIAGGVGYSKAKDVPTGDQVLNSALYAINSSPYALGTCYACTTKTSDQDHDTAWDITFGYQITRYFGIEAFYSDLGKITADGSQTGNYVLLGVTPATGTIGVSEKIQSKTVGFALTAGYPVLDALRIYAKAGGYAFKTDTKASVSVSGTTTGVITPQSFSQSASQSESNNGENWLFGIGAGYALTSHWQLVVEWDRFFSVDSAEGNTDVDVYKGSVQYHF